MRLSGEVYDVLNERHEVAGARVDEAAHLTVAHAEHANDARAFAGPHRARELGQGGRHQLRAKDPGCTRDGARNFAGAGE